MVFDLDPAIVHVWIFEIRYYGVLFGSAFIVGYLILLWMWKKEGRPAAEIDILILYTALGVVVGARLGQVLFYEPKFYLSHPIEILKIWHGGLASHGAAIGVLITTILVCRRLKCRFAWLADRMIVPIALGTSFIRIGNFTNSEIVGRATDLPWAVTFLRYDAIPRHPSQLYEAAAGILIFIVLLFIYKKYRLRIREGVILGTFFILYFSLRFLIEFVKEYQALSSSSPLTMGQILSLPFILVGVVMLYKLRPWLAVKEPAPAPRPAASGKKKNKKKRSNKK